MNLGPGRRGYGLDFDTQILVASLGTAQDIVDLALVGVRHFTAAPDLLDGLLPHELTAAAVNRFEADPQTAPAATSAQEG